MGGNREVAILPWITSQFTGFHWPRRVLLEMAGHFVGRIAFLLDENKFLFRFSPVSIGYDNLICQKKKVGHPFDAASLSVTLDRCGNEMRSTSTSWWYHRHEWNSTFHGLHKHEKRFSTQTNSSIFILVHHYNSLLGPGSILVFFNQFPFHSKQKKTEKPLTCGGRVNVSNLRGYLRSFGYPEYYHGATLCRWTLRAAAGRRIRFQLLDLSIAGDRTRPFYFF